MKIIIATHAQAASGLVSAFTMIAGDGDVFKTCLLNDSGIADFSKRYGSGLPSE